MGYQGIARKYSPVHRNSIPDIQNQDDAGKKVPRFPQSDAGPGVCRRGMMWLKKPYYNRSVKKS